MTNNDAYRHFLNVPFAIQDKFIGETLYKRTQSDGIQTWRMERVENKYRTISGKLDGKQVTSSWRTAKGKNIGKANETTDVQQAQSEVDSKYTKQRDKGYRESIGGAMDVTDFRPMLAKTYDPEKGLSLPTNKLSVIQPKLDGIRCIATKNGLFTRSGKEIVSCPHIRDSLSKFFAHYPNAVLDGELYNHTYKHDFNKIVSLVRKTKPTNEDLEESKSIIQYHIYDGGMDTQEIGLVPFRSRFRILCGLIGRIIPVYAHFCIKFVETEDIEGYSDIDRCYTKFVENGYEGAMIRVGECLYEQGKRSANLLKYKSFMSEEFELVDITEGSGNWEGYAKVAELKLKDGRTFEATIAMSQLEAKKLLSEKNKYIGTPTTVVFQNYTPDGIPRIGVVKEFNRTDNEAT